MTIDAPALQSGSGSTGTAAMAAAPDFAAAGSAPPSPAGHHVVAPTAGMAPAPARAVPSTGPATAVPIVPPPPVRASGGGGGKGLLIGLIAFGALLAIGLVIVALRSMKPSDDGQTLTNPFSSSSGVATIAPQVDTAVPVASGVVTGSSSQPSATAQTADKPPPKGDGKSGTGGGAGGPPNAAACDRCIAAASGGNITGAASAYRQCNDGGKKAQCSARAKSSAPAAAQRAAMNGNCGQARAIAAAAGVMGAGSGGLDNIAKSCK